jgi:hypothetical protein
MRAWIIVAVAVLAIAGRPASVVAACAGDCSADGEVTVDELVLGVNIALGNTALSQCRSFDSSGDGEVTVDELIGAVNSALTGCPMGEATPTVTATATVPPVLATPTPGIVPPGISAALIGTWSGRAVNEPQGILRNARMKVEVVNNMVVVTDLNHNVFASGQQITMSFTPAAPQALFSTRLVGGFAESFTLSLTPPGGLAGIYGTTSLSFPPVVTALALDLAKEP